MDSASLGEIEVKDLAGQPVKFGSAWAEGPAVFVFLRHFGCLLCREHARDFQPHEAELEKQGVKLIYVGLGTPLMAQDFSEQLGVHAPVWTDKERKTYKALGMKRGWKTVLNRHSLGAAARALLKGNFQGRTQGNPVQQGGVLVVKRGGEPVFNYVSAVAGDHPPMNDVLGAVRTALR